MNVVMLRRSTAASPVRRGPGHRRGDGVHPRELDALLELAELGLLEIADLQAEMVAVPPPCRGRDHAGLRLGQPGQGGRDRAILGDGVELLPRPADVPDVVEDADTLEGNARLKAAAIAAATGHAGRRRRHRPRGRSPSAVPGVHTAGTPASTPLRREPGQAARRARRRPRPPGEVPHRGRWCVARRARAARRRRVRRHDRRPPSAGERVRLRRRVRAGRRRRAHVRRDEPRSRSTPCRTGRWRCAPLLGAARCTVTSSPRWSLPGSRGRRRRRRRARR